MLPVYVPSKSRAKASLFQSGPLKYMDEATRLLVTYFVPVGERAAYLAAIGQAGYAVGEVVECEAVGIAATRLAVGRYAADRAQDAFIMLDDDVKLQRRIFGDTTKLQAQQPHDVVEMLRDVEDCLINRGYAHVGVSPREGNNRVGVGDRYDENLRQDNTRTLRALAYRTDDFMACEHGRVAVMEDFDVNLQLLERGRPNCSLFWWTQDQSMTNAPGGCSTYRTHEVHETSARRLAELHPDVVRLRQKENKTGGAFGSRTEVTISWKKAYAQATSLAA